MWMFLRFASKPVVLLNNVVTQLNRNIIFIVFISIFLREYNKCLFIIFANLFIHLMKWNLFRPSMSHPCVYTIKTGCLFFNDILYRFCRVRYCFQKFSFLQISVLSSYAPVWVVMKRITFTLFVCFFSKKN